MIVLPLLGLILCVILSALFSSSETGFLSVNRIRLRHLVETGDKAAARISRMMKNPDEFFSFILVGNNLVVIAASAIGTVLSITLFGPSRGPLIGSIILTLVILLFGEVIPKTLSRQYADSFAFKVVPILDVFRKILSPVTALFVFILKVARTEEEKKRKKSPFVTREEMHLLVKEGERTGALESHERDMIHSIFSFGKMRVDDVMVPMTDVVVIDKDSTQKELLLIAKEHNHTRIPVFDDRIDNLVGVVNINEVLYSPKKRWQECIRDVLFVPEMKPVGALIKELQRRHERLAIVINEYGGPVGVATMEDLMEEIVGDIYDDDEEQLIRKAGQNSFVISGKCDVERVNEMANLSLSTDSFETISGYIFDRLGKVPKPGEKVRGPKFTLVVEKMDKNRIVTVRLHLK